MGRRPAKLDDLAMNNVGILCWCNKCRHRVSVPFGFAIALFGRDCPVPRIAHRLRCSKCGSRNVATFPDRPSNWKPAYPNSGKNRSCRLQRRDAGLVVVAHGVDAAADRSCCDPIGGKGGKEGRAGRPMTYRGRSRAS